MVTAKRRQKSIWKVLTESALNTDSNHGNYQVPTKINMENIDRERKRAQTKEPIHG